VVGVYFAVKLLGLGRHPASAGRMVGYALLGIAVPVGLYFAIRPLHLDQGTQAILFFVAALIMLFVAWRGWPALGRTLFAYGLAARIPVALVMLAAILGSWGTHYDVVPPDFPSMSPLAKWLYIGLLPQLTGWMGFTMAVGMLFGGFAVAAVGRRSTAAA
jgi:hypothetical protein